MKRVPVLKNFFKHILVPLDFSSFSESALEVAIALAKQFGAEITLVYVIEQHTFTDFESTFPIMVYTEETKKRALDRLNEIRDELGADAASIKDIKVVVGKPFQEIVDLARGLRADLIVIPTHGRTGLKHVLLGSTAEKVVRHATCPVLIVKGNQLLHSRPGAIAKAGSTA